MKRTKSGSSSKETNAEGNDAREPNNTRAMTENGAAGKGDWKSILDIVRTANQLEEAEMTASPFTDREISYWIHPSPMRTDRHELRVRIGWRERKLTGEWSEARFTRIQIHELSRLPDPADRILLRLLLDLSTAHSWPSASHTLDPEVRLSEEAAVALLPRIIATGRAWIQASSNDFPDDVEEPEPREIGPLAWEGGTEWKIRIEARQATEGFFALEAILIRGVERIDARNAALILRCGLFAIENRVMKFDQTDPAAFALIELLTSGQYFCVPARKLDEFLKFGIENSTSIEWETPETHRFHFTKIAPIPLLRLTRPKSPPGLASRGCHSSRRDRTPRLKIRGSLHFDYSERVVDADDPRRRLVRIDERSCIERDGAAELAARERMARAGFRETKMNQEPKLARMIPSRRVPKAVTELIREGWRVEAEGRLYRSNAKFSFSVDSGIDWFEMEGKADFDGAGVELPKLLEAFRKGESFVVLDDGTLGLLPEEWLRRYANVMSLGEPEGGRIRFRRSQALLLDAFLAEQPGVSIDAAFRKIRDELARFERIDPIREPDPFGVRLRSYQRWALGWFAFLRKFGFGGCLADDMGLGKTIMVLALLESRRFDRKVRKPTLVVAPRSLLFNWRKEASRCAPKLRVLQHAGAMRAASNSEFSNHDLILTTYDLLHRDIRLFKDFEFDYAILDEAQYAKNSMTARSYAVRLLKADHRLALSGTPIENHIGELWTMFEFLNPGMLGGAPVLSRWAGSIVSPESDVERSLLARSIRPFMLRRTKDQVLKSLPARTEQTVYCEMEPVQRRMYDQLRDHYRAELSGHIERHGMSGSGMYVIEALLRLRQAACHPGLVDRRRATETSAKMELLLPMIEQGLAEGRKALVFSQFTSHLALLRRLIDRRKWKYEYLDGGTADRQSRVEHFQSDPDCQLFLISLKAGGVGLNLTAADLVFILDPWWNPAVEAQAIDRAHRIGQKRSVLARRLITRGTVEEKVLELQDKKRGLASAIIGQDARLLKNMTRGDLEFLLSDNRA